MGNNVSRTAAESRLSKALPPVQRESLLDDGDVNIPADAFKSESERKRLIGCILAIASQNGRQDLERHDFSLVYSRRDTDGVAVSVIAVREGVIEAKIESYDDGKDEIEAFLALQMEIERRMDKLLQDIPSVAQPQPTDPVDAPPAYDSGERATNDDEKC